MPQDDQNNDLEIDITDLVGPDYLDIVKASMAVVESIDGTAYKTVTEVTTELRDRSADGISVSIDGDALADLVEALAAHRLVSD